MPSAAVRYYEPEDQAQSLLVLRDMAERATVDPDIRAIALMIVRGCDGRDDACELEAIYNAVKHGDPKVFGLRRGVKYMADPRFADYFEGPKDLLVACERGANGSDCDGHACLIAALAGAIGWRSGLRAWGKNGGYAHVYAVVCYPKRPPWQKVVALDTTVEDFSLGDEPPRADVLNAWLS